MINYSNNNNTVAVMEIMMMMMIIIIIIIIIIYNTRFTARPHCSQCRVQTAVLATGCLSVCLSVTFRRFVETNEHRAVFSVR